MQGEPIGVFTNSIFTKKLNALQNEALQIYTEHFYALTEEADSRQDRVIQNIAVEKDTVVKYNLESSKHYTLGNFIKLPRTRQV